MIQDSSGRLLPSLRYPLNIPLTTGRFVCWDRSNCTSSLHSCQRENNESGSLGTELWSASLCPDIRSSLASVQPILLNSDLSYPRPQSYIDWEKDSSHSVSHKDCPSLTEAKTSLSRSSACAPSEQVLHQGTTIQCGSITD